MPCRPVREKEDAMRDTIDRVVDFWRELWADEWSRLALLWVLTLTFLLIAELIRVNPPVDWSQ